MEKMEKKDKYISILDTLIRLGSTFRTFTTLILQKMSQYYKIYIYTATSSAYASAILGYIEP